MSKKNSLSSLRYLEKISFRIISWVGTPYSIILHSLLFIGIFALNFMGINIDQILLLLTTAVSLEAIYLSIFIQMTVNRNTASLHVVKENIEDIQEDVDELSEDIEDIQEDDTKDIKTKKILEDLENGLQKLLAEVETLKKKNSL